MGDSDPVALETSNVHDMNATQFVAGPGALGPKNAALHEQAMATLSTVQARREARPIQEFTTYKIERLFTQLRDIVSAVGHGVPHITFIERGKFADDLCVKIPTALKELGNKRYISEVIPNVAAALQSSAPFSQGIITRVTPTGIYVNLALSDGFLDELLTDVHHRGRSYGETDRLRGHSVMVDYSSPNAAKKLHAGHIRSTILGEVLCNLYEAAGATAHRLNHINDLGGFGLYLEGYRRWKELLPAGANKNEQLATLYRLNRLTEKVFEENRWGERLSEEERSAIELLFGKLDSSEDFRGKYRDYAAAASRRFEALEAGDPDEVSLWSEMVEWSLDDFAQFYSLLKVKHDYILGESFYAPLSTHLIGEAQRSGTIERFTPSAAEDALRRVALALSEEKLSSAEAEHRRKEIEGDVGAVVVPLSSDRRLVVLRSDGRTIYATRDLGAIWYRTLFIRPDRMVYVVGQEQKEHFEGVFEAAALLKIGGNTRFDHLYFGFYVDSKSKKKLSSRDGASNVIRLLTESVAFFARKFEGREDFTPEEIATTSHQLALGSVIFNDLKKGRRNNVELPSDLAQVFEEFEKSGGAYVMYTACRARSILRKAPATFSLSKVTRQMPYEQSEIEITKQLSAFPETVAQAAERDDPAALLNSLLEISRQYNSYYNAVPVLKGGIVHEHRLLLTAAVAQSLENGLRFCHIECPSRI